MEGPVVWGNEATSVSTKLKIGRALYNCLVLFDIALVAAAITAVIILFYHSIGIPWWLFGIIIWTALCLILSFIGWCVNAFLSQLP